MTVVPDSEQDSKRGLVEQRLTVFARYADPKQCGAGLLEGGLVRQVPLTPLYVAVAQPSCCKKQLPMSDLEYVITRVVAVE